MKSEAHRMDTTELVAHYTAWAPQMQNLDRFYDWLMREIERAGIPSSASVLDAGCGTGALLARLAGRGFDHLTGIDFAPGCLELAAATLAGNQVALQRHDLEAGPLEQRFDLILLTTVIDFLPHPEAALRHIHAMLTGEGRLIVTIRNRLAYWPWYHLKPLVSWSGWPPRIAHWLQWFTLPLPMRRSDQPYERIYSPAEMRRLLEACGFRVVSERAGAYLAMLRIPGTGRLERLVDRIDRALQRLPATPLGYEFMFICKAS